jgi:hypothetical protein
MLRGHHHTDQGGGTRGAEDDDAGGTAQAGFGPVPALWRVGLDGAWHVGSLPRRSDRPPSEHPQIDSLAGSPVGLL